MELKRAQQFAGIQKFISSKMDITRGLLHINPSPAAVPGPARGAERVTMFMCMVPDSSELFFLCATAVVHRINPAHPLKTQDGCSVIQQ